MIVLVIAVLSAVIAAQQALFVYAARAAAEERRRFLAAVMSKDPGEYVAVERATAPRAKKVKRQRDETVPPQPYGL